MCDASWLSSPGEKPRLDAAPTENYEVPINMTAGWHRDHRIEVDGAVLENICHAVGARARKGTHVPIRSSREWHTKHE